MIQIQSYIKERGRVSNHLKITRAESHNHSASTASTLGPNYKSNPSNNQINKTLKRNEIKETIKYKPIKELDQYTHIMKLNQLKDKRINHEEKEDENPCSNQSHESTQDTDEQGDDISGGD